MRNTNIEILIATLLKKERLREVENAIKRNRHIEAQRLKTLYSSKPYDTTMKGLGIERAL